jgi:hypothetical protein
LKIIASAHFKKLSTKQKSHKYLPIHIRTSQHNRSIPDPEATLPAFGDQKIPLTLKNGTHVRNGFWDILGLKKPLSLDGYHETT